MKNWMSETPSGCRDGGGAGQAHLGDKVRAPWGHNREMCLLSAQRAGASVETPPLCPAAAETRLEMYPKMSQDTFLRWCKNGIFCMFLKCDFCIYLYMYANLVLFVQLLYDHAWSLCDQRLSQSGREAKFIELPTSFPWWEGRVSLEGLERDNVLYFSTHPPTRGED